MFKLEIKDGAETEAVTTENLICPIPGITYKVENFALQFRYSNAGTAKVSDIRPKLVGPNQMSYLWGEPPS